MQGTFHGLPARIESKKVKEYLWNPSAMPSARQTNG
jgi:hypothetical protein